ncbi:hypothetical protein R1flu_004551 [Riccia fluitans]|uniref:BTB domain-containing protein n=1 Tax=Riccia fluitans TaxID=41844 RepID=A0ABD1YTP7_9MARC
MAYMPMEEVYSEHEESFTRLDINYAILRKSAYSALTQDMLKMLNNPDSSDMAFRCQDGVKVYACRMLLVSRSSMLRNMLTNGMAESKMSEILLQEIPSPVLLIILEFLYTGWIKPNSIQKQAALYAAESPVPYWKIMLEIVRAARFFLLKSVEDIIIQKLWSEAKSLVEPETQVAKAALRLSIATDFMASVGDDSSSSSDLRVICLKLVKVLQSRNDTEGPGTVSDNLDSFSERAFQFFLQNSRSNRDNDGTLTIEEYKRFRQVILWCATQCLEPGGQLTEINVPTADCALSILKADVDEADVDSVLTPRSIGFSVLWERVKGTLESKLTTTSLDQLLSAIDLNRIHPELLIRVIEKLNIFPTCTLAKTFRVQALARSRLEKENLLLGKRMRSQAEFSLGAGPPWRGERSKSFRPVCREYPWARDISPPSPVFNRWRIDMSEDENGC